MDKIMLDNILKELKFHHRDKSSLLTFYINKRLNESLDVYYKELSKSVDYLNSKNDVKVTRALNRYE